MLSHLTAIRVMEIPLHYAKFNQVALRLKSLRSTIVKVSNNIENIYATARLPLLSTPKPILIQGPKYFTLANSLLELYLIPGYIMNTSKLDNYHRMNIRRSCITS